MNVNELKLLFAQMRDYTPESVNELLDFAKKSYIHNEISINDYRILVRDLESQGAVVPEILKENSLVETSN
ncbi:YppF family protein [Mesobacillus harenae]|uniref:YppF family protein n=1 Tax=Mesobacillus harenae TaxID=2213203 RepID=UPI001580CAFD|nr:YppF family protein [Mesobacillus harenae]